MDGMAATVLTIVAALIAAAHWGPAGGAHLAPGEHHRGGGGEEYGAELHVSSSVLQLAPLEAVEWHAGHPSADWEQASSVADQTPPHIGGSDIWLPEEQHPPSHLGGSVFSSDGHHDAPPLSLGGGPMHGPVIGVDLPEIKDNVDFTKSGGWKEPQHYKTSYGK